MRYSLLRMVQLILSAMDSDEVNSIADTTESLQVVDVIETAYYDLVSQLELPEHDDLFELEASGDTTRPTLMTIPDEVTFIDWIEYDNKDGGTVRDFQPVHYMDRVSFFRSMNGLNTADTNVYQYNLLVGAETFDVRGFNDRQPTFYTDIGDNRLVFDNYAVAEGSTLIANRTKAYGSKIPVFTRSDTFTPDLDPRQFSLLFNEAKSQAFVELKQITNNKAEQRARRGWSYSQRKKDRLNKDRGYYSFTPNYGRKRQ